MKLFMFRTAAPRRFSYRPRYYDPKKEALEKRKAELGLETGLTLEEKLRLRLSQRWRKDTQPSNFGGKGFTFIIYAVVIIGGIYAIFFTNLIDALIRALLLR